MPYIKTQVDRVYLPSDPSYWVDLRQRFTWGDKRTIAKAQLSPELKQALQAAIANGLDVSDPANQKELAAEFATEGDSMTANSLLVLSMISEWNLTDENDAKLPINAASLDLLDDEDGDFLLEEAGKRARKAPVAQGPLETPSMPSSEVPGTPILESGITQTSY